MPANQPNRRFVIGVLIALAAAALFVIVWPARAEDGWRVDPEISWYGPGLYGNRTACGHRLTMTLVGVAHKSLPCGTSVTFRHAGRIVTVPVVDRGPYWPGRIFDLTRGACVELNHCWTGKIEYRIGGQVSRQVEPRTTPPATDAGQAEPPDLLVGPR